MDAEDFLREPSPDDYLAGNPQFLELGDGELDDLLSAAAAHWDGADAQEWVRGAAVLDAQADLIYDAQHQPWHDGMFEPGLIQNWIRIEIRKRSLSLREYLRKVRTQTLEGTTDV